MTEKIVHSFIVALEWRIFAFVITNLFLWITTGSFWTAAGLALILQVILFFAYTLWYFWRQELHMPFFPQFKLSKKQKRQVL
jgi:hypothetical protein